jgi:1,2-diacylglycerol 3-alpha-glucosyltransferase
LAGRRLRIAVFSDSALPILNGVSVSIDLLVQELRAQGHSVHIFTAAHFGFKDPDPNTYRFPAFETPWTKDYPLAFPPFYPLLHFFRRHTFDIIHTHTPWTLGFVGLRWAQSAGIPVVSTYHTHYDKYSHYIPFVPKRYLRYKIAKHTNYYYNLCQHVITPSEASKRWLRRHSVTTPVTVVPTGHGTGKRLDREAVRTQLGVRPEEKILLYVGRIALEKNMTVLIEAAAHVLAREPMARFWLVGDGPYRDQCAELCRLLGIGDRTKFVGFVPRADVDRYYAASDLFLFASMTETQGLVVTEAMAQGVPPVVVQGGGAGAAVINGESGIIVPNDPEDLGDAALALFADQARYDAMSEAAVLKASAFGTAEMTSRIVAIYEDVITQFADGVPRIQAPDYPAKSPQDPGVRPS